MPQKTPELEDPNRPYDTAEPEISFVAETAALYGVAPRQLQRALWVAKHLIPEELKLMEGLSELESDDPERRRRLAHGLCAAVEDLRTGSSADPLAEVDQPMELEQGVAATVWADLEATGHRARLLRECLSAEEAGNLTHRSRQAVERQRRDGRLLALRAGRQWRYPGWQFDVDGPGGLVPHLPEVVDSLHLSPAGAAHWLTSPRPELAGETPIQLLRNRNPKPVLRLAEQLGHLP